jgi:hypothetical protein
MNLLKRNHKINSIHINNKNKNLGIKLTKEVKDFYNENDKMQKKEIGDAKNVKISHVHGLEELILLKYLYYPK